MIMPIVAYGDPVLRKRSIEIEKDYPGLNELISDMFETMHEAPGVGLAAPQVDVSLRAIVVEYGDEEDKEVPPKLYMVANPEITRFQNTISINTGVILNPASIN